MQIKIKPFHTSIHPLRGVLIKGTDPTGWVQAFQTLGLTLDRMEVFPIPGLKANSVWGCLAVLGRDQKVKDIGRYELVQLVNNILFIPTQSILLPMLRLGEIEKIFGSTRHIMHPEFGLVELKEQIDWFDLILNPVALEYTILKPTEGVFIPRQIKSFQVIPVPAEEVLNQLENDFPQKETLNDKPLNILEKGKLMFYKQFFSPLDLSGKSIEGGGESSKGLDRLSRFSEWLFPKNANWLNKMQSDFEDLERRNKKEVDKLLDLLKNNPEEALKYAIPLDQEGTSRGGNFGGEFKMSRRWGDFSLYGNNRGRNNGNGAVDLGDHFFKLRQEYLNTALDLIKKKEYKKAAFIYMKLLKDYSLAASALEQGGFYQEAASVYLKYLNDKRKAAESYEKGNYINEAIELYKELKENEKVGDLYLKINKVKLAYIYFEKVVENYKEKNQFVKASLLYKHKMNDDQKAQDLLLSGWRLNKDAFNCLNNYFNNIHDQKILWTEIKTIYDHDVNNNNKNVFLKLLEIEYKKRKELSTNIRDIAYEIIADQVKTKPAIISKLISFNKTDDKLTKDTIWFKTGRAR